MLTKEIADFLSADLIGDPNIEITGIAGYEYAVTGDISFLIRPVESFTSASAVIVPRSFNLDRPFVLLKVDNPKLAFASIAKKLSKPRPGYADDRPSYISPSANVLTRNLGSFVSVGANSTIGEGCEIGNGVSIGRNVVINERTIIHPNCTIYDHVEIGRACIVHAGTVIGADGFGYVSDENGRHLQFPQVGGVKIADYVDIGANCTIDRGSLGLTEIGEGTKIDNMVHIAHNVRIGKRVLIAGQSGIAGSSTVEDDVVIAGQVGISDHVIIKAGVTIGAKSAVFPNKILRAGFWMGIPAEPIEDYKKRILSRRQAAKKTTE